MVVSSALCYKSLKKAQRKRFGMLLLKETHKRLSVPDSSLETSFDLLLHGEGRRCSQIATADYNYKKETCIKGLKGLFCEFMSVDAPLFIGAHEQNEGVGQFMLCSFGCCACNHVII